MKYPNSETSKESINLKKRAAIIVKRLAERFPNARCELFYKTPYQLLVSVVLSAQATDKSVNAAMMPIYQADFDPKVLISWGAEEFLQKIKKIGLAPTKSKNVYNLSQILLEKYDGQIPRNREELEALPGVGRKTANVVLGEIFGQPTLAVDTHVFRVSLRLGLHKTNTPLKAEQQLLQVFLAKDLPLAHHLFIFQGRYVCRAKNPLCAECILSDICKSKDKSKKKNR